MTPWKPSHDTVLVWTFDDDGLAKFHVEAPTQEEADAWADAAHSTGKHSEVQRLRETEATR